MIPLCYEILHFIFPSRVLQLSFVMKREVDEDGRIHWIIESISFECPFVTSSIYLKISYSCTFLPLLFKVSRLVNWCIILYLFIILHSFYFKTYPTILKTVVLCRGPLYRWSFFEREATKKFRIRCTYRYPGSILY